MFTDNPTEPNERPIDHERLNRIKETEMSGVLNWALAGLRRVAANEYRLKSPDCIKLATFQQIAESDIVFRFLRDWCEPADEILTNEQLLGTFKEYVASEGMHGVKTTTPHYLLKRMRHWAATRPEWSGLNFTEVGWDHFEGRTKRSVRGIKIKPAYSGPEEIQYPEGM